MIARASSLPALASSPASDYPGMPEVGVEYSGDEASRVATHFDCLNDLDSVEDRFREALKIPGGVPALLQAYLDADRPQIRRDAIAAFISEVMKSGNKEKAMFQIAFAVNLVCEGTRSMAAAAREFGTSKEAFQQGVESHRERLGLGQNRGMRSESARDTMRLTNCRPRLALPGVKEAA